MKTAVENDLMIIREFGVARESDVRHGMAPRVASLVRSVASRTAGDGGDFDETRAVLEYVANSFPPAWLQMAELYEDMEDLTAAADACYRYLQAASSDPAGWRYLAKLSRQRRDHVGEMHALLEAAQMPNVPFKDVSDAAHRFNYHIQNGNLDLDSGEKRVMAEKLRRIMESRLSEADTTDLSRLRWVCMHLGDVDAALRYARRGLELEPDNEGFLRFISSMPSENVRRGRDVFGQVD